MPDSTSTGYLTSPSIQGGTIAFTTEDDLWLVDAAGGVARRITSNLGPVGRPAISPDGEHIAFTGTEEAHSEVFAMPAGGGPSQRITYLGANTAVRGWTPDGRILFQSDAGAPFAGDYAMHAVDPGGGQPEKLPFGPSTDASFAPGGTGVVIGRHTVDPARWKRYRGGTRGELWVDRKGDGNFRRLVQLESNLASPMWIGSRIYFLSDHEGIGNIYSCRADGRDLRRHTDHGDYYARWAHSDGVRVVYQHAADIWLFDPTTDETSQVDIELRSPRIQRNRKFVDAAKFLHDWTIHPEGHSIALTSRGKLFTMPLWEEAVRQIGRRDGVRYRHPHWTHDGASIVTVSDDGGEEALEVWPVGDPGNAVRLDELDVGRIVELEPSPVRNEVVLANHRNELLHVDLGARTSKVLDRSRFATISGIAWSADGRWVAYAKSNSQHSTSITVVEPATGATNAITGTDFEDRAPFFDPEGRYLYFLSYRVFDPVYDAVYFDLGFPRAVRPQAVTLRADDPSPFVPKPRAVGKPTKKTDEPEPKNDEPKAVEIDFTGIADRVVAFPLPEGRYTQIWGIKGKVLMTTQPVVGALNQEIFSTDAEARGKLEVYDLAELKHDTLVQGITGFRVSQNGSTLLYQARRRLRAIKAGEKPDAAVEKEGPGRRSGWIDLGRVRVSVDPAAEFRQMFREAWRFQRDHFWVPDMSGVDWNRIHDRYRPLVEKVASRIEFGDLMWEMLGELGTSHAYSMGGDVKPPPPYPVGQLGADLELDARSGRWKIGRIVRGDVWDSRRDSPLRGPGIGIKEGDTILAVNGQTVGRDVSPQQLLVNQAGVDVELVVGDARGRKPRTVIVRTLRDERPARYREWVENNRRTVAEATKGRVGYVHVPDMGPNGYAEFHRYYRVEIERDALIVDVRHNGGGHVSSLILEKLARERIAFQVPRWGAPDPYPEESPGGPMVCITDEKAGSDGDIFTHGFKLKKLGPVVGKRTWGGVIGIDAKHVLVDNGMTTQPEYSFWFKDVGWGVENYGTDPDYDVDIRPQDHAAGRDPQMDRAIALATRALRTFKPLGPDLKVRPRLTLPKLPPRG